MARRMYINKEMNIYYDFDQFCLFADGEYVSDDKGERDHLTPNANDVLAWLATNSPNQVTAESILINTGRDEYDVGTVKNNISEIRAYMKRHGIENIISTKRGRGYSCLYKLEKSDESESISVKEDAFTKILISPNEYCLSHGIIGFSDQGIDMRPFLEAKNNIYVVATTGSNLISNRWSQNGFITSKLIEGTTFHIIIANKHSELSNDVFSIEERSIDLGLEFVRTIQNLQKAIVEARNHNGNRTIGKIYFGCCFSLLRQTITLGVDDNKQAWGWLSMTLPPGITVSGNTSFAFEGDIIQPHTFAYDTYHHIQALIKEARDKREGAWVEITPEISPETFYFRVRYKKEQQPFIRQWWEQKLESAQLQMMAHQGFQNILIEVAALHPLNADGMPALEFQRRLDYAIELYRKLKDENSGRKIHIYVPGSVHKPDKIALSDAGKNYLTQCGISEDEILGDEKNNEYKGTQGVYNSADECYVSAQIFKNGEYCHLHLVCSPNQLARKTLFYIQFGVVPIIHTVPLDPLESQQSSHDFLYEVFEALPDVLYCDHDWQNQNSLDAIRTRKDRQPGYDKS